MLFRGSVPKWAVDVGFATLAMLLGALLLLGELSEPTEEIPLDERLFLEAVSGAIYLAVFLAFRRRWPVKVTLPLILFGFISSIGIAVTAVALLNVALHRSWRVTAAVTAMNVGAIATVFLLPEPSRGEYLLGLVVVLLLDSVLVVSGLLVRSQRQLVGSLQDRARQAEQEQLLRVEEARHLERERLAREMHDVLAHRISLLAVHAGALEYRQDVSPAELRRAAAVIRQNAYEAMEDLREVLGVLRNSATGEDQQRPQPTMTDLATLIEESETAGADVDLDLSVDDVSAVPDRVGRHVYRIVQEGLTNARKHAPGSPVRVTVGGLPAAELTVEVRNRAVSAEQGGPDRNGARTPLRGAGAGLVGLRERVDLLGGRLEHHVTPDGGFVLRASLPWPP